MKRRSFLISLAGVGIAAARPWKMFPLLPRAEPRRQSADVLYISLHRANPELSKHGAEARYVGYKRVPMPRTAGAWRINGTDNIRVSNSQPIVFPQVISGTETLRYFGIYDTEGHLLFYGKLAASAAMYPGITLSFPPTYLSLDFPVLA